MSVRALLRVPATRASRLMVLLVALAITATVLVVGPAAKASVTKGSTRSGFTTAVSMKVISRASALTGIRYRYGGTSPRSGFDCSGYVGYVYKGMGVKLPRTSRAMYRTATKISRSSARPGDLVFFKHGGRVYHVGIYAGNGMLYHASRPGTPTRKSKIWSKRVSFGRVW